MTSNWGIADYKNIINGGMLFTILGIFSFFFFRPGYAGYIIAPLLITSIGLIMLIAGVSKLRSISKAGEVIDAAVVAAITGASNIVFAFLFLFGIFAIILGATAGNGIMVGIGLLLIITGITLGIGGNIWGNRKQKEDNQRNANKPDHGKIQAAAWHHHNDRK